MAGDEREPVRNDAPSATPGGVGTKRSSRRVILWVAAASAALVVLGLLVYAFASYNTVATKIRPPEKVRVRIDEALVAAKQESPFTYVLLLGQDRKPGEKQTRTDTIVLARLDSRDHSVVMVSIPRDTRTQVKGYGLTKINHASAYGGIPLAIETVKSFTGLPVNHYLEIDFEGFKQVVDELGGVDMYVSAPVNYGDGESVSVGWQHLNGQEALQVMRNRKAYGDGDFARMDNQQLFLKAIARKMAQPASLTRLPRVLSNAADHVQTDMQLSEIVEFVRDYRTDDKGKMHSYTVPGQPKMIGGVSYVIPDEARTKALFDSIRKGEIPPPSLGYRIGVD